MTTRALTAQTTLTNIEPAFLRERLCAEAKEHDIPLSEQGESLVLHTQIGELRLHAERQLLEIATTQADWLYMLKDAVVGHLAQVDASAAEQLRWSDGESAGLPPDLMLCRVERSQRISSDFIRVYLQAEHFRGFGPESIHFRLLLPANPAAPVWPQLSANGQTQWPAGDDAVHTAVYTTRLLDAAQGRQCFDVYLHDGGPTAEWALGLSGGEPVGIIGPRGRGVPECERITLFGDETAWPAIAEITQALAGRASGNVYLEGEQHDYPIEFPEGFTCHWLNRNGGGKKMIDLALAMEDDGGYLWFAAEAQQAKRVRQHLRGQLGWPAERSYIAGFWTHHSS